MQRYLYIIFAIVISACHSNRQEDAHHHIQPKVVEAKGYVVPNDSIQPPVVIKIDESKLKRFEATASKVIFYQEL